jgi:tetratricopeptide (TPR) repeat protein
MPAVPSDATPRWRILLAAGVIMLAALAVYHNSLQVPFTFDDRESITQNPTIRQLWPIGPAFSPPAGVGVDGRPLANFSFALNYAYGGLAVRGYHLLNLAIHIGSGLVLLGVVRRTLLQPVLAQRCGAAALPLAAAVAVIWTVHPLATEAVTYVSQRTESLMGLCYLLTLYCFMRGTESPAPGRWFVPGVTACLLGMASKEAMVTAPLMVFLHDRTFCAGSFREAWRRRRPLYFGMAGTWLMLGTLPASLYARGAGFGFKVDGGTYALTECRALVHYFRLAVWPHPLVFDYGSGVFVRRAAEAAPAAAILAVLAAATAAGLWRRSATGFLGAWFFIILAPTSSIVPVPLQPVAENRMYLPLAAVVALGVTGVHALAGRRSRILLIVLAAGLAGLAVQRNRTYQSETELWADTTVKCPDNGRAQYNLANALTRAGRIPEAIPHYEQSLRLKPDDFAAHNNLGLSLVRLGRVPEAIAHYEAALRLKPDFAEVDNNLGLALAQTGRLTEAVRSYRAALRIRPDLAEAHFNLGNALLKLGRVPEAITHYERGLRLRPDAHGIRRELNRLREFQQSTAREN